jgi:galactonate dehydratase
MPKWLGIDREGSMRITEVITYVIKQRSDESYARRSEDGTPPDPQPGYFIGEPWRSLYSPRMETVLVRVVTDTGTEGWGEALAPVGPEIVAAIIDRLLGPWLVGQDPRRVRPLWDGMRDLMRERGHLVGHQADALAALDIALGDLLGHVTGQPIAQLLGGAYRTEIPSYVSGLPAPNDEGRAALAAEWAQKGATRVKLALGMGVEADLATFDAVAAAAPSLGIAVDAHWAYDLGDALRLGAGLDKRGALFLEAPLAPEDVRGHQDVAARISTTVAVGEALRNRYEFADWLGRRALGLAQPDVARTGITEAMVIANLASAHHVPIACHHSVGLGVALAAGLQVSAAVRACPYFEFQSFVLPFAQRILREPLVAGPTGFTLPAGPGLGVDVDVDAVVALAKEN